MRLKVSNVCQLLDKSKYPETQTIDGVTFTNNGDGTITANGTSTKNYASYNIIKTPRPPIGHKILVLPENNYNTQNHIFIWGGTDDGIYRDDLGYAGSILTITGIGTSLKRSYTTISISLNVNEGWVMNNHIYKPQLFDLTEMYGAGNEPTTVAQFRQDFPNEMYDYSPECWKKFRRLKYIANKEPVQLLDKSKFPATTTKNGVTFTNNGDGLITVDGTATSNVAYDLTDYFSINMNHKYIIRESNSGTGNSQAFISTLLDDNRSRYGGYYPSNGIFKFASYNGMTPIKAIGTFYASSGEAFTNRTISNFMLFDLTAMYGAGNEPTTVGQFRADFPNELYDYNPYNAITFR